MNLTNNNYKESFQIHSHEVDLNGYAHPHFLFSYMVDCASTHVIGSQFSYEALLNEGQLWVLSRFFAVFHKLPKWKDEVIVETWGKGIDKLFGLRDFTITSPAGEKYVSATSAWLLIDRKSSRPQRLEKLKAHFPFQLEKHELDVKLEKIQPLSSGSKNADFIVHHTDIDVNKHVGSSIYMQWILDSFPIEILKEKRLHSFEINYLAEAQINEKVGVILNETEGFYTCEIHREKDNTILCRARIAWNNSKV